MAQQVKKDQQLIHYRIWSKIKNITLVEINYYQNTLACITSENILYFCDLITKKHLPIEISLAQMFHDPTFSQNFKIISMSFSKNSNYITLLESFGKTLYLLKLYGQFQVMQKINLNKTYNNIIMDSTKKYHFMLTGPESIVYSSFKDCIKDNFLNSQTKQCILSHQSTPCKFINSYQQNIILIEYQDAILLKSKSTKDTKFVLLYSQQTVEIARINLIEDESISFGTKIQKFYSYQKDTLVLMKLSQGLDYYKLNCSENEEYFQLISKTQQKEISMFAIQWDTPMIEQLQVRINKLYFLICQPTLIESTIKFYKDSCFYYFNKIANPSCSETDC